MTIRLTACVSILAMAWSAGVQAAVDLSTLDQGMAGPRTQVLVLGSVHLSQMPKGFKPESLQPLLARLAAYQPTIITIEAVSGETCDLMARYPALYDPEDVKTYCWDTQAARAATGLGIPEALAEIDKTLRNWPAQPTPADRRHLAALFMASGDNASALTQWLQMPESERHAGDGLEQALVEQLQKFMTYRNENFSIAARLAARLGLQRVYPVDEHVGDMQVDTGAYGKAVEKAWAAAAARAQPLREHEAVLRQAGDILGLYRYVNSPLWQQTEIGIDFGAALGDKSSRHYGQLYVGSWEARNLRMVSNVRVAFREHPGARVLSIVGASHKPWFDRLLGLMQGVDVVDAEKVLGSGPEDHN